MISGFVSRGGIKLDFALEHFKINLSDLVCADFGCSTGGFTGVMLNRGAKKIYSVDTSYGELSWVLRNNSKVVVLEKNNAMHVTLPELCDFISIDVGWTKQADIIPNALSNLKDDGMCVSLYKPQYEFGKGRFVIEDLTFDYVSHIKEVVDKCGGVYVDYVKSPIVGLRGKNAEFLLFLRKKHD